MLNRSMTEMEFAHAQVTTYSEGVDEGFRRGLMAGISAFAHWKDGTQYVGTSGQKLSDVLKQISEASDEELRRNWMSFYGG